MRGSLTRLPGVLIALICAVRAASALDSTKQISQYGHTAWRIMEAPLEGTPFALAQTTDGYLWIGTQAGLLRFDGVRFVAWRATDGHASESSRVTALLGSRDGS